MTPTQAVHCPFSGTRAVFFLSVQNKNKTNKQTKKSHGYQYKMGITRSKRRTVSPNPSRRSGRGCRRRNMRKADRLSKMYFRMCSWNCASANRRGAVLEKMVYYFDEVCLQETRTCPNRPLVLQGFTFIQRHQGRDMAIVVWSYLSKTVSLLNLNRWSTQGIRIETPGERHTDSYQCIHPPLHLHHRGGRYNHNMR